MKTLTEKEIDEILLEYKTKISKSSKEEVHRILTEKISKHLETKAVLGFDIYRYSQYPLLEQTLIPHVFKDNYNWTITNCLKHEPFVFQGKTKKDFTDNFIDNGDGGFQIFDNPFHALIFSIYFQSNIKRFNSCKDPDPTLRHLTGEVTLRYALTLDKTYSFGKNFYGPSIINNSRIMAKDKLNRFLLDENTVNWFTNEFNGVENLQAISYADQFKKIDFFKTYKWTKKKIEPTILFSDNESKILKVDLLKIGEIKSKLDTLSVHSLHLQISMYSKVQKYFDQYVVSLGNLNPEGIID